MLYIKAYIKLLLVTIITLLLPYFISFEKVYSVTKFIVIFTCKHVKMLFYMFIFISLIILSFTGTFSPELAYSHDQRYSVKVLRPSSNL